MFIHFTNGPLLILTGNELRNLANGNGLSLRDVVSINVLLVHGI